MEQSSDGLPISQRRANSSTKHSSKSDEVAEDMLQSNIPHETVRLCQGVESEEIEGPPHKKIVQNFTESSSSKNKKHRWSSEESCLDYNIYHSHCILYLFKIETN